MVSFVFRNPAGIFRDLRKFVLAVGILKDTTTIGSKIGWPESLFRIRTKKFLFKLCNHKKIEEASSKYFAGKFQF